MSNKKLYITTARILNGGYDNMLEYNTIIRNSSMRNMILNKDENGNWFICLASIENLFKFSEIIGMSLVICPKFKNDKDYVIVKDDFADYI